MYQKILKYLIIILFVMLVIPGEKFSMPLAFFMLACLFGEGGVAGIVVTLFSIVGFFYLWVSALQNSSSKKNAFFCLLSVISLFSMFAYFSEEFINRRNIYCDITTPAFFLVAILLIFSIIKSLRKP